MIIKTYILKTSFTLVALLFFATASESQVTLVLQPGPEEGKDVLLHGLQGKRDENLGDNPQLVANAWTYQSEPGIVRSVFSFDLSPVPQGSSVVSAYLSLYAWNSDQSQGPHSALSGSNDFLLKRITSYWQEETVTWNTQPATTNTNQLLLEGTDDPAKDYLDIDVTALVTDMVNDPGNSFGFMIRLQTEQYYRRINFCSSDHVDPVKHPRLVVTYFEGDTCTVFHPER